MKIPQNRTFSKDRKGNQGCIKGVASRGVKLTRGDWGLKALEPYKITPAQIESMRKVIVKEMKSTGSKDSKALTINVFPDKPISKKPIGIRMGGGKGPVDCWVCLVKPGKILFELKGIDKNTALVALTKASYKIPIKTVFITREELI